MQRVMMHVGESCTEEPFTLRLTQVPPIFSDNAGRLEVCLDGEWGAIVGPPSPSGFWPLKNVLVACKQLGYDVGLNSIPLTGYIMQNMRDCVHNYVCVHV